ncbi:MAG: leucine-rich repeat protein, partial [Peptococcaceae bacterium]|nr:leucine-rich repeat protein [Peptococcaceae bacterium]
PAAAADDTTTEQPQATAGTCGAEGHEADVTWNFDAASGTLTISGTGAMADYVRNKEPWYGLRESLTKIVVDKGVTRIGDNAFSGLAQLQTVSLPDGLTAIGDYAFFTCTALGEVTIPASVTDMGANPFRECSSLSAINLADGSSFQKSGNALLSADGSQLISYPAASDGDSFSVPNGVTTIQDGAFGGTTTLTSITIPDSVTTLGEWCFADSALTNITLPASVTSLGSYAFRGCTGLTAISIPESITTLPAGLFDDCQRLEKISNIDQVTEIGQFAFRHTGLTTFEIPASVTTMGYQAFANNKRLETVTIGSGQISGSNRWFEGCDNLKVAVFTDKDHFSLPDRTFLNCASLLAIDATAYSGTIDTGNKLAYNGLAGLDGTIFYTSNPITVNFEKSGIAQAVTNGGALSVDDLLANGHALTTPTYADGTAFAGWNNASGESAAKGQTYTANVNRLSGTEAGVDWSFAPATGVLTISAAENPADGATAGEMKNYNTWTENNYSNAPWYTFRNDIKEIVVAADVTKMGNNAFYGYDNLKKVVFKGGAFDKTQAQTPFVKSALEIATFSNSDALVIPKKLFDGCANLKVVDATAYNGTITLNGANSAWEFLAGADNAVFVSQQPVTNNSANIGNVIFANVSTTPVTFDLAKSGLDAIVSNGHSVTWTETTLNKATQNKATWTPSGKSFTPVEINASVDKLETTKATISGDITDASSSDKSICTVSVTGGEVAVTPDTNLAVGTYETTIIVYTDNAAHVVPVTINVTKADSTVTPDKQEISATYGETVELTVNIGKASKARALSADVPLNNVSFYNGNTYLGTVRVDNGKATLNYDTTAKGLLPNVANTVTAYYGGSDNLNPSDAAAKFKVNVQQKGLTVKDLTATDRTYEAGNKTVALMGGKLTGTASGDNVSAVMPTEGTMSDDAVGQDKSVTIPTITLTGADAGYYKLTQPTGVTVNITAAANPGTPGAAVYAIAVDKADHGTIAVNPTKAVRGKTVTITAKADAGYAVDAVKVTDRNDKSVKVTANSDGTYSFTMPASKVDVSVSFKAASVDPQPQPTPENPFTDVADDAYYYDAVLWAVDNKITNGTSATTFSPNLACTRAQMICFLWNQAGQPDPTSEEMPFTDVAEGTYYHDAVQWAVEKGLAAGTSNTTFSPNATLTRGQTVTFLYRAAGEPAVNADSSFTDVADGAYYADAVAWAVQNGVTNGTSANTFSPDADCTRGQIVTFLWRAATDK